MNKRLWIAGFFVAVIALAMCALVLPGPLQEKALAARTAVAEILTPEQRAQLPAFGPGAGPGFGPGFGPGRGFGPGMGMGMGPRMGFGPRW